MDSRRLDLLHLFVTALTLVGWGTLLYALVVFDDARPEMSTIITQYHQIEVREFWLVSVYDKLVWLLWFCAGISMVNIMLNVYLRQIEKGNSWAAPALLFAVVIIAIAVLTIWQPMMEPQAIVHHVSTVIASS